MPLGPAKGPGCGGNSPGMMVPKIDLRAIVASRSYKKRPETMTAWFGSSATLKRDCWRAAVSTSIRTSSASTRYELSRKDVLSKFQFLEQPSLNDASLASQAHNSSYVVYSLA